MALRPLSIVGESLGFGVRRFETVLRVSFLPLVLVLVFEMAATLAYLSFASGRLITFKDLAEAKVGWAQASRMADGALAQGLGAGSPEYWTIYAASALITAILVASFMAPLVRYAGLGERPAPGLVRIPFGPDQIRYLLAGLFSILIFALVVYAPVTFATASIIGFITQALSTPYASFPDAASLHTIDIIAGAETLGVKWFHQYQAWGLAGLAATLLLIVLLTVHFAPRAVDKSAGIGLLGRILGVTAGFGLFIAVVLFLYVSFMRMVAAGYAQAGQAVPPDFLSLDALSPALFLIAALSFAAFVSLRLFPYVGVAVCRRSMAMGPALGVTRRFDVLRLALAFVLLGIIVFAVQVALVIIGGGAAMMAVGAIATAAQSVLRLISGGEGGDWVYPFFTWLWAAIGIVFTLMWTAFSYGVAAGLSGRLYRDAMAT